MSKVLIIGAGGVGGVVAHKCAMNADVFSPDHPGQPDQVQMRQASRPRSARCTRPRHRHRAIDADNVPETVALIRASSSPTGAQRRAALPGPDHHGRVPRGRRRTTSTPPTTSRRTWPSSNTSGSGPTRSGSSKAGLMALLGCGLRPRRDQRLLAPTRQKHHFDEHRTRSTSSTATPAATARPSPPTSTPRSTSARSPSRAATGTTASGSRSEPLTEQQAFDFPRHRAHEVLPAVPRGARVAGQELPHGSSASASG